MPSKQKQRNFDAIRAKATWPEAEIVALPVSMKELTSPRLLVRRKAGSLYGPRGEELIYLPGAGTCISLFTGCGGMDLGCEQAGFVTVVQHEWDDTACETLLTNRPDFFRDAALIQGDIRQTPTTMLLEAAGLRVGEADLLTGGPPCQGFSTAGKRQTSDIRNTLVFEYLRVVRQAQPKYFVMENVLGFLSLAKGRFFADFLAYAHGECFYEMVYGLVNACEHGVPQDRCRFICMGTRRDVCEIEGKIAGLPRPTHFSPPDVAMLTDLHGRPLFRQEYDDFRCPPGIRYFPDRPLLIPPRPIRNGSDGDRGRSESFVAFYKRLREREPDRLVDIEPPEPHERWNTVEDAIRDLPELVG